MDLALGIAGVICVAMAIGHTAVGLIWVLPHITEDTLPRTPFGSSSMSVSMVRVTWFIVTIFAASIGGVLITLAWAPTADPRTAALRWFAIAWFAATLMAFAVALRRAGSVKNLLPSLLRLPVPLLWVVVSVICWKAAS